MSDYVARAKELNARISKANRSTGEARTRKQVKEENFLKKLEIFGKSEGVELVELYNEKGLDHIKSVLSNMKNKAEEIVSADVAHAERCISAYENKDFNGLNILLGQVAEVAEVGKRVEEPVEKPAPAPVQEEPEQVKESPKAFDFTEMKTVSKTEDEDPWKGTPVVAEPVIADEEETTSSVFNSIADEEDEGDSSSNYEQSTQPNLSAFLASAPQVANPEVVEAKEEPAKKASPFNEFFVDSDDEKDTAPKSAAVNSSSSSSNTFDFSDDEEDEDSSAVSDISLTALLGNSGNINAGSKEF